eukprot:59639-Hanusia_phi.AAC.1
MDRGREGEGRMSTAGGGLTWDCSGRRDVDGSEARPRVRAAERLLAEGDKGVVADRADSGKQCLTGIAADHDVGDACVQGGRRGVVDVARSLTIDALAVVVRPAHSQVNLVLVHCRESGEQQRERCFPCQGAPLEMSEHTGAAASDTERPRERGGERTACGAAHGGEVGEAVELRAVEAVGPDDIGGGQGKALEQRSQRHVVVAVGSCVVESADRRDRT